MGKRTVSKEEIEQIRSQLSTFIAESGSSQSHISREMGVSKSALSLFLAGTYTGNNQEMADKANQYMKMHLSRQSVVKAPEVFLGLGNTVEILRNTKIAHLYNNMVLVYGPAGCGKTTALKHYAETNNGVIYVQADVTVNSYRAILSLILSTMGGTPKGSTMSIMQTLVSRLTGTNNLLIIDEAQHLTEKAFDTVRALNDKCKIGIVYAGNPSILKRMYGRMAEEFDQVYSRITYKCKLQNSYTLNDVSNIFQPYQMDKECLKYLYNISRQKGGLRLMTSQSWIALNLAAALNQRFSLEHLEKAAAMMGI